MRIQGAVLQTLVHKLEAIPVDKVYGQVETVRGLLVEIAGPVHLIHIGARAHIQSHTTHSILCEIIGFQGDKALALPFGSLEGVCKGARVFIESLGQFIFPSEKWLGRVVNGLGQPIDGKGELIDGTTPYDLKSSPPLAHKRQKVGVPMNLGVKAFDCFTTCCYGQRMGIFAGTGVGKSVLFSMFARNAECDVSIIGLIGERGREVQEFIHNDLGEEGLKRSIVVVATSDETALMRRQAAYLTLTLAEYFRDQKKQVLCMIDSITRFAMAQRDIGLSCGEPPTTRGYTPTVFSELPKLLERAGPGEDEGAITGLFTVLVEGDDHNEPIADAVRGILDGHVVMERAIAERGRYPAINILKSLSRTMPDCVPKQYMPVVIKAKDLMSTYTDMEELIRLGAYRMGSNTKVDEAIDLNEPLEHFLAQNKDEKYTLNESYEALAYILRNHIEMSDPGFELVEGIEQ